MRLTDTGESRIRGYLYMLSRALRTPGAAAFADEALKEVESHIRERLASISTDDHERTVRAGIPVSHARNTSCLRLRS